MSGPGIIRLKRKRDQQPPDALIIEPQSKRVQGEDGSLNAHYRRKEDNNVTIPSASAVYTPSSSNLEGTSGSLVQGRALRRTFQIRRASGIGIGRRKQRGTSSDHVATVIETQVNREDHQQLSTPSKTREAPSTPSSGLKRPGKGALAGLGRVGSDNQLQAQGGPVPQLQLIANELAQFAEDELTREEKPKLLATPKLAGSRSRELHRQKIASSAAATPQAVSVEVEMAEDDGDYVYDTYVLTSGVDASPASSDIINSGANVGYIVITEADQAIWETYLEEDSSDKEFNEDEEDENAEDWYGADYPEDEVASDDEFNRNAYQYRGRDSDEEWDADTGNFSDDEYEKQMNPWRNMSTKDFLQNLKEQKD